MVRARHFIPGPSALVFALVLLLILTRGRLVLFNDPGTLWHLRLGRDIVASGTVPRCDTLSFSQLDRPWVDQSWGFDAGLALLVDQAGWSVTVALTAILLAGIYAALAGGLVRDGTSPVTAVYVALTMMSIGCIHFLIRPHILTLAFVYLTLRICQKQHERGGWIVAWVPLMTALMANLHGGFLALPGIAATAAVGHAVAGPWDDARRNNVAKFMLAFVASCLAALINPYGWGLYQHVGNLLVTSGVTALIDEYKPAPFGKPEAQVLEMSLLSLMALPMLVSRRVDRYHLVQVLVWLHLALTSIRNAPFFALAAAPALATLIDGLPVRFAEWWPARSGRRYGIPALAGFVLLLAFVGVPLGTLDTGKWPLKALPALNQQPLGARLFHEQDWGGLIEAETSPLRRAYVDDRFEVFGKTAILEYVEALAGGPAWETVRDREKIALVWLKPDRGLSKRLGHEPGWTEVYHDKLSVLYARTPEGTVVAGLTSSPPRRP